MWNDPDKLLLNLAVASTLAYFALVAGPAYSGSAPDARTFLDRVLVGETVTQKVAAITTVGGAYLKVASPE